MKRSISFIAAVATLTAAAYATISKNEAPSPSDISAAEQQNNASAADVQAEPEELHAESHDAGSATEKANEARTPETDGLQTERYTAEDEPAALTDAARDSENDFGLMEKIDGAELPLIPLAAGRDNAALPPTENRLADIPEPVVYDVPSMLDAQPVGTTENKADAESNMQTALDENTPENADQLEQNGRAPVEPESADASPESVVTPSRTMAVQTNQLFSVEYPGNGWIYQGNIDENGLRDMRQRNFVFGGRKLNSQNQSYTLCALRSGAYLLHFYKNDVLSGNYIDDYLEVVVSEGAAGDAVILKAPDYAEVIPPKINSDERAAENDEKLSARTERQTRLDSSTEGASFSLRPIVSAHNSAAQTIPLYAAAPDEDKTRAVQQREAAAALSVAKAEQAEYAAEPLPSNTARAADNSSGRDITVGEAAPDAATELQANPEQAETPQPVNATASQTPVEADAPSPSAMLAEAEQYYEKKEYAAALAALSDFFERSPAEQDAGLFLQGRIFEAQSHIRNIKNAIDSYDRLVRDYPASRFKEQAARRSRYLKYFYINNQVGR